MDCASACKCDEELSLLIAYWEKLGGGRLSFEHQSRLDAYLRRPDLGYSWLKNIMLEASNANGNTKYLTPKFLFAVIDRRLSGAQQRQMAKGGEQRVSSESNQDPRDHWEFS